MSAALHYADNPALSPKARLMLGYREAAIEWDQRRRGREPVRPGYPSHAKMRDVAVEACRELAGELIGEGA